jgi:hypothetical protein
MSNLTDFRKPEKKNLYKVLTIMAGDDAAYDSLEVLLNDGWDLIDVISVDGVEGLHASETTFILFKA